MLSPMKREERAVLHQTFPGARPILIVGSTRSGTTLMRSVLSAHSSIAICDGLHYFLEVVHFARRHPDLADPATRDRFFDWLPRARHASHLVEILPCLPTIRERLAALPAPTYAHYFLLAMQAFAEGRGKSRFGDKTCAHVRYLDALFELFPDARVVHMVRDPRGCVASHLAVGWASHEVVSHAIKWRAKIASFADFVQRRPELRDQLLEVRYEDLALGPEQAVRRVCAFLGEPFEPGMLEHHRHSGLHVAHQPWKLGVTRPIYATAVGKWRDVLDPPRIALIERLTEDLMGPYGYVPIRPRVSWRALAWRGMREAGGFATHKVRQWLADRGEEAFYHDRGFGHAVLDALRPGRTARSAERVDLA
jgi:hypothetical protein